MALSLTCCGQEWLLPFWGPLLPSREDRTSHNSLWGSGWLSLIVRFERQDCSQAGALGTCVMERHRHTCQWLSCPVESGAEMQSQDVPRGCLVLDAEKIRCANILLPYTSTRGLPRGQQGPWELGWPNLAWPLWFWEIKHLVFSCKHQ